MDEKLPTDYDAIILGTGMAECILAAALSRIGNKVLHLDRNDYYSGDWAGFNLQAMQKWIDLHTGVTDSDVTLKEFDVKSLIEDSELVTDLPLRSGSIKNVKHSVYISDEIPVAISPDVESTTLADSEGVRCEGIQERGTQDDEEGAEVSQNEKNEETEASRGQEAPPAAESNHEEPASLQTIMRRNWCVQDLKREWRKFNLDLMPKVLYSRGPMVELLISSDIAKYCEFRSTTRILTFLNGELQKVPCSRADVFGSKQVSMIEKRMLMKLLTFCLDYENQPTEYEGYEDKTFVEFLKSKKLTPTVMHFILHAIARVDDEALTLEGLKATQKFLQSLGRYGNTAFLWPLYGAGELPQAFCRVCAVFGGTYCLKRTAVAMVTEMDDSQKIKAIVDTEGQRLNTKWLIMESSYRPKEEQIFEKWISRAILLTDQSILPDSSEHISLLNLPKEGPIMEPVTVMELSSLSLACPQDLYVVHMSCKMTTDAESDLMPVIEKLFAPLDSEQGSTQNKPKVLMSLLFNIADTNSCKVRGQGPAGVHCVGGPTEELDFDEAISQARKIFEELCPGEEFLPKAPNPEDIILEGEEGEKGSGYEKEEGKEEAQGGEEESSEDKSKGEKEEKEETEEQELAETKE